MSKYQKSINLRNYRGGGQIAELGPALLLILCVFVFPILECIYLGSAYCFGWYLNHLVVREASIHAPNDTENLTSAINQITEQWKKGIGSFTGGNANNTLPPTYEPNSIDPDTVTVKTNVVVRPFFPIPFFAAIPGLNAPITFSYSSHTQQEEKGTN